MRVIASLIPLAVLLGTYSCGGDDEPFASGDTTLPDAGASDDASASTKPDPDAGSRYCEQGCAAGERCDELTDECVECLFDHDCGEAARCTKDRECLDTVACENSLDCRDAPGDATVCDENAGLCVVCVGDADCGDDGRCVDSECVPFEACTTTDDCTSGVCDEEAGACVECVEDADCGDEQACVRNSCRDAVPCTSDNDCTPMGLLCDQSLERCVACRRHSDCPSIYHCSEGDCLLDVCDQGQTACRDGAVASCSEAGDAFVDPAECDPGTICMARGAEASCITPEGGIPDGGGAMSDAGGNAGDGGGTEADGGTAGEDAAVTCTTTFYRDSDNDGFGDPNETTVACEAPDGYVGNADDCYDDSADAKPGQTAYFDTDRGDGSYDYDCVGGETPQWTDTGTCAAFPTCSATAGWSGGEPDCGQPGDWLLSCTGLTTLCQQNTESRTQACR